MRGLAPQYDAFRRTRPQNSVELPKAQIAEIEEFIGAF